MQLSKIVYIVAFKRYEIRDVISSDRSIYFLALSMTDGNWTATFNLSFISDPYPKLSSIIEHFFPTTILPRFYILQTCLFHYLFYKPSAVMLHPRNL